MSKEPIVKCKTCNHIRKVRPHRRAKNPVLAAKVRVQRNCPRGRAKCDIRFKAGCLLTAEISDEVRQLLGI